MDIDHDMNVHCTMYNDHVHNFYHYACTMQMSLMVDFLALLFLEVSGALLVNEVKHLVTFVSFATSFEQLWNQLVGPWWPLQNTQVQFGPPGGRMLELLRLIRFNNRLIMVYLQHIISGSQIYMACSKLPKYSLIISNIQERFKTVTIMKKFQIFPF